MNDIDIEKTTGGVANDNINTPLAKMTSVGLNGMFSNENVNEENKYYKDNLNNEEKKKINSIKDKDNSFFFEKEIVNKDFKEILVKLKVIRLLNQNKGGNYDELYETAMNVEEEYEKKINSPTTNQPIPPVEQPEPPTTNQPIPPVEQPEPPTTNQPIPPVKNVIQDITEQSQQNSSFPIDAVVLFKMLSHLKITFPETNQNNDLILNDDGNENIINSKDTNEKIINQKNDLTIKNYGNQNNDDVSQKREPVANPTGVVQPIDVVVLFKMLFSLNSKNTNQESPVVNPTGGQPIDVVVLFKMLFSLNSQKQNKEISDIKNRERSEEFTQPLPPPKKEPSPPALTPAQPPQEQSQTNLSQLAQPISTYPCDSGSVSVTRRNDFIEWRTIFCNDKCNQRVEKHFDLICFKEDYKNFQEIKTEFLKPNEKYALFVSVNDKFGSFVFVFQHDTAEKTGASVQNALNENCNSLLFLFKTWKKNPTGQPVQQGQNLKNQQGQNFNNQQGQNLNNQQGQNFNNQQWILNTGILLHGVSANATIKYGGKDYNNTESFIQEFEKNEFDKLNNPNKIQEQDVSTKKIRINGGKEKFLKKTSDDIQKTIQQIQDIGSSRINETCLLYRNHLFELKDDLTMTKFYETRGFQCFTPISISEYELYTYYYGEVIKSTLGYNPIEIIQLVPIGEFEPKILEDFHYEYLGELSLQAIKNLLKEKNGPDRSINTGDEIEEIIQRDGSIIYQPVVNPKKTDANLTKPDEKSIQDIPKRQQGVLFRYNRDQKYYISNPVYCKGLTTFPPVVDLKPVIISSKSPLIYPKIRQILNNAGINPSQQSNASLVNPLILNTTKDNLKPVSNPTTLNNTRGNLKPVSTTPARGGKNHKKTVKLKRNKGK